MNSKNPNKRSAGSLSRLVMIMAGRTGRRPINRAHFVVHRERILTAWSRTNLEGRIAKWIAKRVLPSVYIAGEIEFGDEQRWTYEAKALLEAILWKNCC